MTERSMNTALNIRDIGPELKAALAARSKAEGRSMAEVAKDILAKDLCAEPRPRRKLGTLAHLLDEPLDMTAGVGPDPEIMAWVNAPDPLIGDPGERE
jgi:plasmid stability protein